MWWKNSNCLKDLLSTGNYYKNEDEGLGSLCRHETEGSRFIEVLECETQCNCSNALINPVVYNFHLFSIFASLHLERENTCN